MVLVVVVVMVVVAVDVGILTNILLLFARRKVSRKQARCKVELRRQDRGPYGRQTTQRLENGGRSCLGLREAHKGRGMVGGGVENRAGRGRAGGGYSGDHATWHRFVFAILCSPGYWWTP